MKPKAHHLLTFASAALLAAATLTTHAQTWTTVFGGVPGVCGDIGKDAAGKVYAAGRNTAANGSSVAVVLGRDQASGSWVGLDAYAEPGLSYAHNRAFAAAPAGASPRLWKCAGKAQRRRRFPSAALRRSEHLVRSWAASSARNPARFWTA